MTLSEYINQQEPVHMPIVLLQPGEYTTRLNYYDPGSQEDRSYIIIHQYPEAEYVCRGKNGRLWTADEHGNPKACSCFYI